MVFCDVIAVVLVILTNAFSFNYLCQWHQHGRKHYRQHGRHGIVFKFFVE
jgi:hypothetical protein